jgi:energy-converting hydrogenase A subunit M
MSGYLYEKDLTAMKYAILVSTRHDRVVREISGILRIPVQQTRRILIEEMDMILLENLPARYQASRDQTDPKDPVAIALGSEILTRAVPILDKETMETVMQRVKNMISGGMAEGRAIDAGREMLRRVVAP